MPLPYRMVQLERSSNCYAYRCTYSEVHDITIPAEDARGAIGASAMAAFDAKMAEAARLVGK